MALQTKTLSANGAKRHHKFTLTVTENSTNVANNTSSLAWSFVISPVVKDFDWISNSGKVKYSVTINGNTYSGAIKTYDGKSTVTIKSAVETVEHDTDGSKTLSYSFSITDSTGWSFAPGNASASDTMNLTVIPRQATLETAPNFNDDQDPTITYSNPAGNAVTALEACISLDGKVDHIKYRPILTTETSYTFPLTDDEKNLLRNATTESNSRTVSFHVRTVIGGETFWSQKTRTLTIVNADPVITPTITDTNAATEALTGGGALVRYFSNAYFQTGASAQKGATIVSQSVTCGGVTLEGATGTFTGVQSGNFVFTVTDSRGNTTTLPVTMNFVEYVKPTCSIGNSKPDTEGNFTLTASGVCYNGIITGEVSNDIHVFYRYKVSGGSYSDDDWKEMAVTLGDNTYTATVDLVGLDYRTTYIFQCKVVDTLTTATTDEVAIKSMPVFDWSGEDFNFNVPVNAPSMNLGGVELDYIVEQGTKDGWLYRKWNSGVMECWCRLQVTTDVSTAWGSFYISGAISRTNLTYPYAFTEIPHLTVSLIPFGVHGMVMAPGSTYGSATQTGAFEIARGISTTDAQFLIAYHAIGSWK